MAGTFGGVLGRRLWDRFVTGHLADVLVVLVLCVVVIALTRPAYVAGRVDVGTTTSALTLIAAAVGSAAAIVALVTGRLTGDRRASWFGAALFLYGVVLLPMSALVVREGGAPARLAVLVMLVVCLCILVIALRPPARMGAWGGWALVGLALVLGAGVAVLGETRLGVSVATGPFTSMIAQAGWATVAVLFLLEGYRRQSRVRSRLGLGMLVIALSQLYRTVVPSEPVTGLVYPSLRVAGMAVVLSALLTLALRAVSQLRADYDRSQEEIGAAARRLERATELTAERDHELRNGLAGLAGAAYLLSRRDGGPDADRLRAALITELGRLRDLLEDPARADMPPPPGTTVPGERDRHAVEPVVREIVGLRVAEDITLRLDEGLPAVAAPQEVTRQVLTCLLQNCRRHAPGAPVVVRAVVDPGCDAVRIEVRDHGPGLPDGQDELRIERGAHDEAAGGSGYGLHINSRLAEQYHGRLVLRSASDPRGCLAVFTLPAAH